MQKREIQYLEEHIPALAQSAITQAYWQSLAAGYSVLESENHPQIGYAKAIDC